MIVDVPRAIHGSRGAIVFESNDPDICSDGRVARQIGLGWFVITYAPRDPELRSVSDLTAKLLVDGSIELAWSDIQGERWYAPVWRPKGQAQWISINYLPNYRYRYPANTSTLNVKGLDPPESFEFSIQAQNYVSSTWSNVASVGVTRRGGLQIIGNPFQNNPFCSQNPVVVDISAFFDQNQNGLVEGFPNSSSSIIFPADIEVSLLSRFGYDVLRGRQYATGQGTQANLVIVARVQSCPHNGDQFVAIHYVVFGPSGERTFEPVLMVAGDLFNELVTGEPKPLKGIVMKGGFDGTLDQTDFTNNIASGKVSGSVTQFTPGGKRPSHGVGISFSFEVPIEIR